MNALGHIRIMEIIGQHRTAIEVGEQRCLIVLCLLGQFVFALLDLPPNGGRDQWYVR